MVYKLDCGRVYVSKDSTDRIDPRWKH